MQLTSVSNVAIIIATGPFVAAAFAWIWLRQAARWQTMAASLVALGGVAIIVGNLRAGFDILGIALACLMTVAIAAMTVAVRRHRDTPIVAAAALSNFLGSIVKIPFAHGVISVAASELVILAMFGFFQVALGLTLFMLGSRLAVRTGHLDRDAGDAADAVLGMDGISGGSRLAGAGRRRAGDGSCDRRYRQRCTFGETTGLIRPPIPDHPSI